MVQPPGEAGVARRGHSMLRVPLLERETEIGRMVTALSASKDGQGSTLVIRGHAGIGKTRLLDELAVRARSESMQALRVRCWPLEREFTFGVPLGLFERLLDGSDATPAPSLLEGAAAAAAPIFHAGAGMATEGRAFPLLHGLYWLTANLASDSPLLIAVDDAQWADLPSLRFLNFLAQRVDAVPVLLAVSIRLGDAEGERASLLDELSASGQVQAIEPATLSAAAVARLISVEMPDPAPEFSAACTEVTGGNPFLLGELIEGLRSEGISATAAEAQRVSRIAPSSLRRAVLLRLGRLDGSAIALAKAVAVLADDAKLRYAADIAGLEIDQAERAADSLLRADILETRDGLEFVHPLVSGSVYAEIGATELGRLHRRAAERLSADGRRPERTAAHLLRADRNADQWVVETLRSAAGEALLRGSPQTAVSYLSRALEEPPEAPGEVLFELGGAQTLAGDPTTAATTLTEALELSPESQAARYRNALGHAHYACGRMAEAAAQFSAGADAAVGDDPEITLRNQADLISIGVLVPELYEQVTTRLPVAIQQVRSSALTGAGRAILASAAIVSMISSQPVESALRLAEEALDEGRLIEEEGADGATVYTITAVLSCSGELARSTEVLDGVAEAGQRDGSAMGYATALYARAQPQFERGRLIEAIADVRGALDLGWRQFLPAAYTVLTRALIEHGEIQAAQAVIAEASAEDWDADLTWALIYWARGALHLATGDPAAALADFRTWGERWLVPNPAFLAEWRSNAAIAAATLGDHEQAVELASEELALVEGFGSARSTGVALHALGLAQRGEEGIETLRSAGEALAASEAQLYRCRAVVDLGASLRRAGRRADARVELKRGLDLAQRMGARRLEQVATEELKLAGGRPGGRKLSGAESLSAGELRVAQMAADGLTNRQIAQSLFVTPKTVEWHLKNTYRKLSIGSRAEIAAALRGPSELV